MDQTARCDLVKYQKYIINMTHPEHPFNTLPVISGEVADRVTGTSVSSCGHQPIQCHWPRYGLSVISVCALLAVICLVDVLCEHVHFWMA